MRRKKNIVKSLDVRLRDITAEFNSKAETTSTDGAQATVAVVVLQVVLFQRQLITSKILAMKFCLWCAQGHWPAATVLYDTKTCRLTDAYTVHTQTQTHTHTHTHTGLPRSCWAAEVNAAESHVRELTWHSAQIQHTAVRLSPSLSFVLSV